MGSKIYTATDASFGIVPAIVESEYAPAMAAVRAAFSGYREAIAQQERADKKAEDAERVRSRRHQETLEAKRRFGLSLIAVRKKWPRSGPRAKGWGDFLACEGIDQDVALDAMKYAGYVEQSSPGTDDDVPGELPTRAEAGLDNRPRKSDLPAVDWDAPRMPVGWDPDDIKPTNENADSTEPERTSGRGKPQWLMQAIVADYTRRGDLVCDPLAGFGSTLIAAEAVGRRGIGSEVDPAIVLESGRGEIRCGDWRTALIDVGDVDAVITDPPYSARTHAASTTRNDGSDAEGLTPTYAAWSTADVAEFVSAWSPRCRGWMVALTDSELIPAWRDAYRAAGRYAFAPIPVVIKGMSVRISGDGPSSWCVYAMVARPANEVFVKWGTLPGAYVGTKSRNLFAEAPGV